jgi:glycosyltransferase involved in cell wall biosynthesis
MAIKVLRIHSRIHLGGPIFNVAYLSKYLAPDFETKLLVGTIQPDEISAEYLLKELGLSYTILPDLKRSINPISEIRAFFKIRKIIKDFKPTIVHTHTAKAGVIGRLAAWSCGVPVIIHTFHGHVFHSYFSGIVTWGIKITERFLSKISTGIIAISEVQKNELATIYKVANPKKIKIIPLGLDLDKFSEKKEVKRKAFREKYDLNVDEVAFALIGRFAPIKNHDLLFEAIKQFKEENNTNFQKSVFFLVGDGELKKEFQKKLKDYNISFSEKCRDFVGGGIIFTSWIKNVDEIMPGFDAVVLTSHNEGTPLSLIESQATGIPVISTRVGGVENVVLHKKTGIIVSSGDKTALSNTFLQFVVDKELRLTLGNNGEAWAQTNFSYRRLVEDMKIYYHSLLSKSKVLDNIE